MNESTNHQFGSFRSPELRNCHQQWPMPSLTSGMPAFPSSYSRMHSRQMSIGGIKSEPVSPVHELNGSGGGPSSNSGSIPSHLMMMRPASVGHSGMPYTNHAPSMDHPPPPNSLPPNNLLPPMGIRDDIEMTGPKRSRLVPEVWTHC